MIVAKDPEETEGVEWGDAGIPPPPYPTVWKGFRAFPVPVTRPTRVEVGPEQSPDFSLSFVARLVVTM